MPSKTPAQYKTSLKDLDARYNVILNEVTSSFPYAKAYPKIKKYTSAYNQDNSSLTQLKADLFIFLEELQNDITDTSNSISRLIKQIEEIENKNFSEMKELNTLSNKSAGAIAMYKDTNFEYNYKFYENIILFLSVSGVSYMLYKYMKSKPN